MPELRIAVVHGQMKPRPLKRQMWDFLNRKYDVLMATTIIESGLDIPSVKHFDSGERPRNGPGPALPAAAAA